jgi:hypothetical protein
MSGSAKTKKEARQLRKTGHPTHTGYVSANLGLQVTTPLLTKSMHMVTNAEMNPIDVGGSF